MCRRILFFCIPLPEEFILSTIRCSLTRKIIRLCVDMLKIVYFCKRINVVGNYGCKTIRSIPKGAFCGNGN